MAQSISKSEKRQNKKRKMNKMIVTGKSVFIIQNAIIKRGQKSKSKGAK